MGREQKCPGRGRGGVRSVHDTVHETVEDDSQVNVAVSPDVSIHPVAAAEGQRR